MYALFVLTAALAMLCFLRAEREPTRARMAAFALTGALALLTHYFAVFLLIADGAVAAARRRGAPSRRAALPAIGGRSRWSGLALLPLISAQGGHGTQWIGRWALSERACRRSPSTTSRATPAHRSGTASSCSSRCRSSPAVALGLWRMFDARARRAGTRERSRRGADEPAAR